MTGKERRKRIIRLAATKGNISAREIAQHFDVSRMTIHRDLRRLEETGQLRCIHGGAMPVFRPHLLARQDFCTTCDKPNLPHQSYLLLFPDQSQNLFCCASCGVKVQIKQAPLGIFYATDMISGKLLPADEAFFLIRSSAEPCCQPSILTFSSEAEASTFRSSFGGVLGRMPEALAFIQTEQALEKSH